MPNIKNIINTHSKKIINPPKDNIRRTCNCIRKHQCPLNEKCLTNNVLYKASITPNEENSKTKFIMVLVKRHLNSDIRTIKKHSITSDTKLIQNYQTNIGILYQQTKLRTSPGKFWEPTNHTTKVLHDIFYVSMKSCQSFRTRMITC